MTSIPSDGTTYRWVAGPSSAKEVSAGYTRMVYKRPRTKLTFLVIWLAFWVYLFVVTADERSVRFRLIITFAITLVFSLAYYLLFKLLIRFQSRRSFKRQIKPGDEMTTTFRPASMVLTTRLTKVELSYEGFGSIVRENGWVFYRHGGSRITQTCPEQLMPDEEIERIRAHAV